jgi:hypothetical protein
MSATINHPPSTINLAGGLVGLVSAMTSKKYINSFECKFLSLNRTALQAGKTEIFIFSSPHSETAEANRQPNSFHIQPRRPST